MCEMGRAKLLQHSVDPRPTTLLSRRSILRAQRSSRWSSRRRRCNYRSIILTKFILAGDFPCAEAFCSSATFLAFAIPATQPAPFQISHDPVPANWRGPVFRLSQQFPKIDPSKATPAPTYPVAANRFPYQAGRVHQGGLRLRAGRQSRSGLGRPEQCSPALVPRTVDALWREGPRVRQRSDA